MIDLKGKSAVVTGGSRGIGQAVCLALARVGAGIVLGFKQNQEAANQTVQKLRDLGVEAVAVRGDVSKSGAAEELIGEAKTRFGGVDIVVANAGVWKRAPIEKMTELEWRETLDVNLTSAYHLCHQASRVMKQQGSGCLILVSSTAGQRGEANYSHYAASKGAIIALTKSLASELGPSQIRVNCVAPGWVDTDMCREVFNDQGFRGKVEKGIPIGRIARPEDLAGPILFLASDLARHVHGEVLNVNGGSVMCG